MIGDGGLAPAVLAGCAAGAAMLAVRRHDRAVVSRIPPPRHSAERPTWPGTAIEAVGRTAWIRRITRVEVSRVRLEAAPVHLGLDRYAGMKAVSALAFMVVALFAPSPVPLLAPVLAAGAFLIPDLVLARMARRRRARMEAQLPQFLDLLAAGSTAGLSALLALRRAAESVRDPLAGELHLLLERVDLGARWRDELHAMAERLHLGDLRRAVMAMTRTESLGTPLAESLRRRADEVREARRAAAAERARKAPVKMLFPLVFCVFPSIFVVVLGPAVIQLSHNL